MFFRFRHRRERRSGPSLHFLSTCLLGVLLSCSLPQSIHARDLDDARSDAAALEHSSRHLRIGVVGDSLGVDLWYGMEGLLRDRRNLKLVKFAKPATGLIRNDVYDWQNELKDFLRDTQLDVITVIIGGNDRQSVWVKGRRLERGTKAWLAEYERRVARFMKTLAATDAKVYWVGLPIVRSEQMSRDYKRLNGIYRAQAKKHGFTYVDIWEPFVDENGGYSPSGRSVEGVMRPLRKEDGLHFTAEGELRLAQIVSDAIGRDLSEIKTAR